MMKISVAVFGVGSKCSPEAGYKPFGQTHRFHLHILCYARSRLHSDDGGDAFV